MIGLIYYDSIFGVESNSSDIVSKKILIISGSPRKNGNSDVLCDRFRSGAEDAGNEVRKVSLAKKKVGFCKGCYHCRDHDGRCVLNDDMSEIMDDIGWADTIVLASPVYFYSVDAQMKAVIDRTVACWTAIKNKEFYYIMTAAEDSDTVMDCTLECFRGFARCLGGSVEKGVIYGKGLYGIGEVEKTPYMDEAYDMGRKV